MSDYSSVLKQSKIDYKENFKKFGDNALGVRWRSEDAADKLYAILSKVVVEFPHASILDVGCGLAHFLTYLEDHGIKHGSYSGTDMVDEYVKSCKKKFPNSKFFTSSFFEDENIIVTADLVTAIGIFNRDMDDAFLMLSKQIEHLYKHSNIACAFNLLVENLESSEAKLKKFHYYDFEQLVRLCSSISSKLTIYKGYNAYGCTIFLYK